MRPVLLDGPLEQVGDVVFLGDVAADADGLAALGADAVYCRLDAAWDSEVALVLGAGRHDDLRALTREHDGHVPADAPARSGNHCDSAI